MHTEVVRRALDAVRMIQSISTLSPAASWQPGPPARTSVSTPAAGASAKATSGMIVMPLDVRSGAPSRLKI